ncbi:hypothetical protein K450DRAFT_243427 [Umbelopsis ramanniana AG]|uniref:PNPLA domain-containing protein n=1 Tax=Umbelopsis ramanniana AG TaxID=1314678 RepID=A0AAD5EBL7_UMBRA|nr:uncharacterized protein K450DRAFT_243427 [Umbelopsis ramanniana AG]KAI8579235.1 hypothetical protein K450DRAFT_243427 [Umbelopsis ramanniana AG]
MPMTPKRKRALNNVIDSFIHWMGKFITFLFSFLIGPGMAMLNNVQSHKIEDQLQTQLKTSSNYRDWRAQAQRLDKMLGNDGWKADPNSKLYDRLLIEYRLRHLKQVRRKNDVNDIIYTLRGGLLRNFGGICDRKLFTRSYIGTKSLIEDYMDEVVSQLEYVETTGELDPQTKLKFFMDTRQSFGCSALILQGGATFGLYHIGVVKALHERDLLPRIISGTAVGALIAALICIHTDEELPNVLKPDGINLTAFSKKSPKGRRITRLLKYGHLMDIKVLQECVRANVGDLTFEEAYDRTKRILNISVSSSRTLEVPQLLNYLTAPNVLIWSAACCSSASIGLFGSSDLLAKNKNGDIVKWSSSAVKWNHWTEASAAEGEAPLLRLSELLNVNHFIVSQANSYFIPFVSNQPNAQHDTLFHKVVYIIASETRHRLFQLNQINLLPRVLRGVIEEKVSGDVTIVPSLSLKDFSTVFANPTQSLLGYWILKGEQSTWPLISLTESRCKIELALDRALLRMRATSENAPIIVHNKVFSHKKRAKSMN